MRAIWPRRRLAYALRCRSPFRPAGSDWSGCAIEIPGVYVCRLPGLRAGGTLDWSMQVLAPLESASAAELGVVAIRIPEYDLSTQESVTLAILDS
jgi:hypothetical protein